MKLQANDYLEIVCEKQKKSVNRYIAAEGRFINYLGAVTADSIWPILKPGENAFSYEADAGVNNLHFSYKYDLKFIGI
jgi:hypothetical protein